MTSLCTTATWEKTNSRAFNRRYSHSVCVSVCVCVCVCTFRDGVEVALLAHGSQQGQRADVDPHLGVAVVLPRVILDHVEQTAD